MTDERLTTDREKLEEAVQIFRTRANLHSNADAEALIRWAHEAGKTKPYADMVRTCWHDFENGRRYNDLPVHAYRMRYPEQPGLFDAPPVQVGDPKVPLSAEEVDLVKKAAGVIDPMTPEQAEEFATKGLESSQSAPACDHKVRVNSGQSVVCDDCGEVLEELPECAHTDIQRGHDNPLEMVCQNCARVVGEFPPEIEKPKDDDQEVLF